MYTVTIMKFNAHFHRFERVIIVTKRARWGGVMFIHWNKRMLSEQEVIISNNDLVILPQAIY